MNKAIYKIHDKTYNIIYKATSFKSMMSIIKQCVAEGIVLEISKIDKDEDEQCSQTVKQ